MNENIDRILEIQLSPNGDFIKMQWRLDGVGNYSLPIKIFAEHVARKSRELREVLCKLNDYIRINNKLIIERDPEWRIYKGILDELRAAGRALRLSILHPLLSSTEEFLQDIRDLPLGTSLKIYCSDHVVTLPFGFVHDGTAWDESDFQRPSLSDFNGFWINRFKISIFVAGGVCNPASLTIDPLNFRTLYAMHEKELEDALYDLNDYADKLRHLLSIEVGECKDWESAKRAWSRIYNRDNVLFFYGHADADALHLANGPKLDCLELIDALREKDPKVITLVILNCCMSATGAQGASLLTVVARRGFCGMIGTEAKILNSKALCCGIQLMWEMCFKGRTLGEALEAIQQNPDLFPLSLFYSCYADRNFRLKQPLSLLGSSSP